MAALRQCDGAHVQAIVMVRDDFWMAATRFMRDLEIRLIEGENSAAVDLFDLLHARRVLTAFGRAYGVLPERSSELTAEQIAFVEQSVAGLAQDGKVISVRLALFAEMVKGKPWSPATLRQVGGTQGVGVTFLDETFSASTAPPEHRLHQKAAQAVLKALLPDSGTDIKGQMRPEAALREASRYASRPRDFDDLIGILNSELRLITPTDPEGIAGDVSAVTANGDRFYQLTHDYLVHSLRDWLTRKQRETRRGRAELRLDERAALWEAKPENRHLPSLWEWASVRTMTRQSDWTEAQRRMMRRAGRVHGLRLSALAVIAAAVVAGGLYGWNRVAEADLAKSSAAASLVEQLLKADTAEVGEHIQAIERYRRWANPSLKQVVAEQWAQPKAKMRASLALLPVDPTQATYLETRLFDASPDEAILLRNALRTRQESLAPKLWAAVESGKAGDSRLLAPAIAPALYKPDDPRWAKHGDKIAQAFFTIDADFVETCLNAFRSVRWRLIAPLATIFRDKSRPETQHILATTILKDYAGDVPESLAGLLMEADPTAFAQFLPVAQRTSASIVPLLQAEIERGRKNRKNAAGSEQIEDSLPDRQARAAVALVHLGQADSVWPLLQHSADPTVRSFIVNWLNLLGVDPSVIASEFHRMNTAADGSIEPAEATADEKTPPAPDVMNPVLFHATLSRKRAIILALGKYGIDGLSAKLLQPLIDALIRLYKNDPDAGIHSAAEWTLHQLKEHAQLNAIAAELANDRQRDPSKRRWYRSVEGHTFTLIGRRATFRMGSPDTETGRNEAQEIPRIVTIPRRFAISTKEVTVAQFRRFIRENDAFSMDAGYLKRFSPNEDGPCITVTLFDAAAYCNWLSEKDGLPKSQWCYLKNASGKYDDGMTIPADVLVRTGYRLPTEAEWEFACRAGSATSWPHGVSVNLLANYAWYESNSKDRAALCGSLLPNDLGLFDMLGSVYEWCQDRFVAHKPTETESVDNGASTNDVILDADMRVSRGGSFRNQASEVRSAHRAGDPAMNANAVVGFRVARTMP